jgi:hypothetical protein
MIPASFTFRTSFECPSCLVVGEISTTFDNIIASCYVELFILLYKICSILLSSLEIIDRTKYVRSILHDRFYNPYYTILAREELRNIFIKPVVKPKEGICIDISFVSYNILK